MSRHATRARDELRRAVQLAYAPVRAAGQDFGKQITALREIEDFVDALRIAAALTQTAATLAASATAMAAKARAALADAMAATGCTGFELNETHQVVLAEKARRAVITDRPAIPERYWTTPEPRIDVGLLTADLLAGSSVDGAELTNPGDKTISIRARERGRKAA